MKIITIDTDRPFELIADSALTMPGKPTFIPDEPEGADWEGQVMLGVRISRLGKSIRPRFASRYFESFSPMLRLICRDAEGKELTGVSAITDFGLAQGEWLPVPPEGTVSVSCGDEVTEMDIVAKAVKAICETSRYATLKMGDIILLPTGLKAVKALPDSETEVRIDGQKALTVRFK